MNKIKEKSLDIIIEEASILFLEKSISAVTMEEIAKKVGIGPASLYRYFKTKQNIAMKAAILMADNIYSTYFQIDESKSGFEQIKDFYNSYLKIFINQRSYYKFIKEFDAQFLSDGLEDKSTYENEIDIFKDTFIKIYNHGLADHSITEVADIDTFYYTTAHAIMNLCKALSVDKRLILQDSAVMPEDEIQELINIVLFRLTIFQEEEK